jgi:hypothetical protein
MSDSVPREQSTQYGGWDPFRAIRDFRVYQTLRVRARSRLLETVGVSIRSRHSIKQC